MQEEQQGPSRSGTFDVLLERIKKGSATEREHALDYLRQRARGSNDPERWNQFAFGLGEAGRNEEALHIYNQLVESFPAMDVYRLNLATTYSQIGQFEMCKYHLRYLAEHGSTEDIRKLGKEQLEVTDRFLKQTGQDRQFRQLQVDSLRERIASSNASADDYEKLGRLLIPMQQQGFETVSFNDIISLLEEGQQRFPKSVGILELLAYCYLKTDPMNRLESVLKKLEKEAPDSQVLRTIGASNDDAKVKAYLQQMRQRTQELWTKAQSQDPDLRMAAVQDMRKIVAMYPSNPEYRTLYAFMLGMVRQYQEAIQQAELLAKEADDSYAVHMNLGQLFWVCGDQVRGRYHLELALKYAQNDEERRGAMERIADLSRR